MSSSRIFLQPATRAFIRRNAIMGAAGSMSLAASMRYHYKQSTVLFDSLPAPRDTRSYATKPPKLDPEMMKQVSGGSLAGFLAGVVISIFSRTLVLVAGLSVVAIQVAARYGIDIVEQLRLKQKVGNSKILNLLQKNPTFKLSFAAFFTMAAFMNF